MKSVIIALSSILTIHRRRRTWVLIAILFLTTLAAFPRQYVSRVKIMPPQSSGAGLGALLSQLGGLASFAPLLNNHQPTEVYLVLARSNDVAEDIVKSLDLQGLFKVTSSDEAIKKLGQWADVHSLRGGVIEIEVTGNDKDHTLLIATEYASAFQRRLSLLAKQEVAQKHSLMTEQLAASNDRLSKAELDMTNFRIKNHAASPEAQLSSSVRILADLHARLQAKEVELSTSQQFTTTSNYNQQRINSEIVSLKSQIDKAENGSEKTDPLGFQNFSTQSSEYLRLFRALKYAEAIYDVYARYLEAVNMENVSSSMNAQVIESPYIDPNMQWNRWAVSVIILLLLAAVYAEYYFSDRK
jgi:capsule polysaccharide export protein KpsE/RkpR